MKHLSTFENHNPYRNNYNSSFRDEAVEEASNLISSLWEKRYEVREFCDKIRQLNQVLDITGPMPETTEQQIKMMSCFEENPIINGEVDDAFTMNFRQFGEVVSDIYQDYNLAINPKLKKPYAIGVFDR